ncbi:uncharacterized protein VP01_4056g1 [Puccinia sorghi]|uniref:Uncharacterized protein n=1 Tax=Puccinia sorghi TaxID=27349 RepID=A0A0L6UTI2_9BASI|nr:uncharacterized protein VP01_4056g1 [Puccinia sorghi]
MMRDHCWDKINFELIDLKNKRYDERVRIVKLLDDEPTRIYNPLLKLKCFDGCKDTPVEVLHVVLLGIVNLKQDGGPSNVKDSMRLQFNQNTWLHIMEVLLAKNTKWFFMKPHLSCMSLQTHIHNMDIFIDKLEGHIRNFMFHIVKMSGRWANKPKFHMLSHLPDSIRRFGPANLFATEKFESYNGVIRNSSIHSNHQSPGRDLANSFSYYQFLRSLSENILTTIQSFKNLWAIIHPKLSDQNSFHVCMEIKAKKIPIRSYPNFSRHIVSTVDARKGIPLATSATKIT